MNNSKNLFMKDSYDVSKMVVLKDKVRTVYLDDYYACDKAKVFSFEDTLSEEEKLEIIDSQTDGLGTYALDLIRSYLIARDEGIIKRTKYCGLNQGSLKAWVKKNDPRHIAYVSYNDSIPTYKIFSVSYKFSLDTPNTTWGYKLLYDGSSVVNQWFHELMIVLYDKENEYFKSVDPIQVKITTLKLLAEGVSLYGVNNDRLFDILSGRCENPSEEELSKYIAIFTDIKNFLNEKKMELTVNEEDM